MEEGSKWLWRTVEDVEVVVVEGEDPALDPGLGLDLVQGIAKDPGPDLSPALDLVPESRKRKIPSLVLAQSLGPRSAPSLVPDPREEASLAPVQVKSPARGPDLAQSLVTRREIQNPDLVLNPSRRRDQSLAPALARDQSLVPDPTAPSLGPSPSLGPDQNPSRGVTSALPQDPAAKTEKLRKPEVTQNPNPDPGLNLQQKMEINPRSQTNHDHDLSLRRKWKRMAETLFPLTTVTTKISSSLAVIIKINVFFSSSFPSVEDTLCIFSEKVSIVTSLLIQLFEIMMFTK